MDAKRILGSPTALLSVPDVLVIGLMAIVALLAAQMIWMSWTQMNLWRASSGTVASPGNGQTSVNLADPAYTSMEAN